jgi:DNA-binding transcriptional LysR family regulator
MSLGDPLSGRDLAAFVTAVETGSVQGAADALALTQSAATKRIQALERRLGRELLDRGSSGVRPTSTGRVLYPLAREALAALERAEAGLNAPDALAVLRIQSSRTVGETLLGQWLAAFRTVVRAVRDGEAEIGFIEGPAETMRGLHELVVAEDEICVVVASDHPWARRRSVPVKALAEQPFLAREAGSGTRAVAAARLSQAGVELMPALEVSSTEGLKRALAAGGFSLLSRRTIAAELSAGTLAAVPVTGTELWRSFRAVRRARPALQGPAREFWRWLETTIAPQAGHGAPSRPIVTRGV